MKQKIYTEKEACELAIRVAQTYYAIKSREQQLMLEDLVQVKIKIAKLILETTLPSYRKETPETIQNILGNFSELEKVCKEY